MKTETIALPCTPVVNGLPTMCEFTGERVGQMFVHKGYHDASYLNTARGDWTITHLKSGYSVKKHIGARSRALALARKLSQLGCWDFSDPDDAKRIAKATLNEIRLLVRQYA